MSVATRIQSMYENVGEVYDTITNVTLPEHKNIENIPRTIRDSYLEIINNGINVIYDNWEKVIGEGTSLTLTPTEEAPMKLVYKGNTLQNGEPTPDYPQDIHVVSGDNSIEICGKNLLNESVMTAKSNCTITNKEITSSALSQYNLFEVNTNNIRLEKNTYYYVTFQAKLNSGTGTLNYGGVLYNGTANTNQWSITKPTISSEYQTFCWRIDTNVDDFVGNVMRFQLGANSSSAVISVKEIIVSKTQDDTYEPYTGASYPINLPEGMELCKIGTYQDKIDKSTGKNLFDSSTQTPIYTNSVSTSSIENGIKVQVGNAGGYRYAVYILGETNSLNGKTIRVNSLFNASGSNVPAYSLIYCDENGGNRTSIIQTTTSGSTISTTINTTNTHIALGLYANNTSTSQASGTYANFTNLIVTLDNEDISYEPYGTSWYLKKEIGKVVLNGSESGWGAHSSTSGTKYRYWLNSSNFTNVFTNIVIKGEAAILGEVLCNYETQALFSNTAYGKFGINTSSTTANNWFLMNFDDSTITTVADFKIWLASHNASVYYPLATPTYTLIEGELLNQLEAIKMSYEGQTNLSQTNNDLPFIINATALKKV